MSNPLRVGFDASGIDPTFKAHAGRGIGRYVQELLTYLRAQDPSCIELEEFSFRDFTLHGAVEKGISFLPAGRQTIRQQLVYPFQLSTGKFRNLDALHFPAHMDAPTWSTKPTIVTVLDLIPLVCSELYSQSAGHFRFRLARALELRAIKRATLLLAISEATASDLTRLLNVPSERIRVTPLGVADDFFIPSVPEHVNEVRHAFNLPLDRPCLLYVGGIDERKNVKGMLRVLSKLSQRRREAGSSLPVLLIAGKIEGDRNYPDIVETIKTLGLETQVRLLGFVPHETLLSLYELADCFLFLSLYEGFGLPPLEAMARGTAVISSGRGALKEVLEGSPALIVDPSDEESVAHKLFDLLARPLDLKMRKEESKAHARTYCWTKTGEKTLLAYEELSKLYRDNPSHASNTSRAP